MLGSLLVLVPVLAPLPAGGGGAPPPYTLAILPSHLPTQPANPGGLSDRGKVVGDGIEQFWFQAAHWPDPETVIDLAATYGFESSFASGINTAGVIVGGGAYDATAQKETAFVLAPGGQPQFLPQLLEDPAAGSYAYAITDSGLVAGWSDTVASIFFGQPHAVLWEGGVARDLGTLPGGDTSNAVALNESKLVVGNATLRQDFPPPLNRGFGWTEETGLVQLPGLDELARTVAADVNASGLIVGDADLGNGRFPAVWPDFDTIDTLPLLPVDEYGSCSGINDHGQIVGSASIGGAFRARLWQGGTPYDLDALTEAGELTVTTPVAINERGQVLTRVWDFVSVPNVPMVGLLTPDGRWEDLGAALAGTYGTPRLLGFGNMLPAGPIVIEVEGALENSLGFMAFGLTAINLPFFGGTLVPNLFPPGFYLGLATDAEGRAGVDFVWPSGLPPGLQLYSQAWLLDPAAPQGLAATNALRATAP